MVSRAVTVALACFAIMNATCLAQSADPIASTERFATNASIVVNLEGSSDIETTTCDDEASANGMVRIAIPVQAFMELTRSKTQLRSGVYHWEPLMNAVRSNVEPGTWRSNGGHAKLDCFQANMCLVVSNKPEIVQQVRAYVAKLTESVAELDKAGFKTRGPQR